MSSCTLVSSVYLFMAYSLIPDQSIHPQLIRSILVNDASSVPLLSGWVPLTIPHISTKFFSVSFKVASKKSTNISEVDEEAVVGVPLEPTVAVSKSSGMTAVTANVESLDGAPLVQYDGDPLDVDGSPLNFGGGDNEEDEGIEGVPLDTAWV